jgi:hypothetical protein
MQRIVKWKKKLIGQGHVIVFATRCEEEPTSDEIMVSMDPRRYPSLRPEQVVEIVKIVNREALAKQAAWVAAHRM